MTTSIADHVDGASMLLDALSNASEYPRNGCGLELHSHSADGLLDQLRVRENHLFGPVPRLQIIDVQQDLRKYRLSTIDEAHHLELYLRLPIDQHAHDPKQRFVFITAPNSRAPLRITKLMLFQTLTYHQVTPVFLDFIFPFGNQHYARDFYFGGFRSETCRLAPIRRLAVPALNRTGRHIEVCYNLKAVERSVDSKANGYQPWVVRQASIHHRFDLHTGHATWHMIKANVLLQEAVVDHLENSRAGSISDEEPPCSLATSLDIHRIVANWSASGWHWYVNDLEVEFQDATRAIINEPQEGNTQDETQPSKLTTGLDPEKRKKSRTWSMQTWMPSRLTFSTSSTICEESVRSPGMELGMMQQQQFPQYEPQVATQELSFEHLQTVQKQEDKANGALLILQSNANVLRELSFEYHLLLAVHDLQFGKEWQSRIGDFCLHLARLVKDLEMQKARMETLRRLIADRKALLQGLLQYRSVQASRELAERAQQTARNMEEMTQQMTEIAQKTVVETVSMRIITVVTLFFLPGTFISTLMSTDIVHFEDGQTGFGANNIGAGALELYLLASLPLMFITFLGWYFVYLRERRRQAKTYPREPAYLG